MEDSFGEKAQFIDMCVKGTINNLAAWIQKLYQGIIYLSIYIYCIHLFAGGGGGGEEVPPRNEGKEPKPK